MRYYVVHSDKWLVLSETIFWSAQEYIPKSFLQEYTDDIVLLRGLDSGFVS